MEEEVRIDKFLWSIRVYKTRSEAADACKSGKVEINGSEAKASRPVKTGDIVSVRKGSVHFSYRVLVPVGNRQGAKLVPEFAENITPQEELDKLNAPFETIYIRRDRGTGRPTKKERRDIDRLMEELGDW